MKKAIVLNGSPVSVPVFYYGRKVQMNCRPPLGGHISYIMKSRNHSVYSKRCDEISQQSVIENRRFGFVSALFAEEAKAERYQLQRIISESGKKGDAMCGKNKKALTDCL